MHEVGWRVKLQLLSKSKPGANLFVHCSKSPYSYTHTHTHTHECTQVYQKHSLCQQGREYTDCNSCKKAEPLRPAKGMLSMTLDFMLTINEALHCLLSIVLSSIRCTSKVPISTSEEKSWVWQYTASSGKAPVLSVESSFITITPRSTLTSTVSTCYGFMRKNFSCIFVFL